MRLKTKLLILRVIYVLVWICRLPIAIVLFPFDLLLRFLQGLYSAFVLIAHQKPTSSIEDRKTACLICGCDVCKQELQRLNAEEAYLKTNEKRDKCKFCGKPTVLNPKTQTHYCPDCG